MGLAGTQRIFALIDEHPEADEGYVTLVNAKEGEMCIRDRLGTVRPEHLALRGGMLQARLRHERNGSLSVLSRDVYKRQEPEPFL